MYYAFIAYDHRNKLFTIGVTNDLKRRLKNINAIKKESGQVKIVYYEAFDNSRQASLKEDQWELMTEKDLTRLVKSNNPLLIDLIKIKNL